MIGELPTKHFAQAYDIVQLRYVYCLDPRRMFSGNAAAIGEHYGVGIFAHLCLSRDREMRAVQAEMQRLLASLIE
jgi:hypothetical protein